MYKQGHCLILWIHKNSKTVIISDSPFLFKLCLQKHSIMVKQCFRSNSFSFSFRRSNYCPLTIKIFCFLFCNLIKFIHGADNFYCSDNGFWHLLSRISSFVLPPPNYVCFLFCVQIDVWNNKNTKNSENLDKIQLQIPSSVRSAQEITQIFENYAQSHFYSIILGFTMLYTLYPLIYLANYHFPFLISFFKFANIQYSWFFIFKLLCWGTFWIHNRILAMYNCVCFFKTLSLFFLLIMEPKNATIGASLAYGMSLFFGKSLTYYFFEHRMRYFASEVFFQFNFFVIFPQFFF